MSAYFIEILLFLVMIVALLSLLQRNLFIAVILLSVFSFISALLFYVAHAPDVAITEAAVGAGMTTLIFIWAVRTGHAKNLGFDPAPGRSISPRRPRVFIKKMGEVMPVLAAGLLLFFFLPDLEGGPHFLRDFIAENGFRDTGAYNLVSAVYLGYRAFDTFGETIVLLSAVSASIYLLGGKDAH